MILTEKENECVVIGVKQSVAAFDKEIRNNVAHHLCVVSIYLGQVKHLTEYQRGCIKSSLDLINILIRNKPLKLSTT